MVEALAPFQVLQEELVRDREADCIENGARCAVSVRGRAATEQGMDIDDDARVCFLVS